MCSICLKDFKQKSHYDRHIIKKIPCVNPIKKIELVLDKVLENKIINILSEKYEVNNNKFIDNIDKSITELDENKNIPTIKKINYIDLFCGLGAFHKAFELNNTNSVKYNCVFACDIDKGIQQLYNENYNITPHGDINKININDIPNFDILCAGFPCQPFSLAGKKEGFNDKEKGNLFFIILNIIDVKKPSQIILENVKNLLSINNGTTFKIIIDELKKRNYNVSYKVIDSKYYNCAQSRQRLFIVCDKNKEYVFNEIKNKIINVSTILDNINDYYDYSNKYTLEEYNSKNKNGCIMKYILINKISKKGGRQGERVYSVDSCGPTICASSGGPGAKTGFYYINNKIRTLTVNESLKMFGFTDYKRKSIPNDNDMLFYLGNSIVVNVLSEIIKNL